MDEIQATYQQKPKENFVFRFFKFIILFFLTDLTAKNQPETTTKPDKQIPGTILSMKLHYNIQEFFQINDWTLVSVEITVIFRYTGNCLLHRISRAQLSVIIVRYVFAKRAVYIFAWCFITPFSFAQILLKNAVGSSFLILFLVTTCAKRLAKIF